MKINNLQIATRFKNLWKRARNKAIAIYRLKTSTWRKLPDFIIIGVQKGGTSSLYYYLSQHPELKLSTRQEIHYYDKNYQNGIGWYKSFFPLSSSPKKTGESTPYYIFHPHVAKRIKKDIPDVKLIVMLRNPVDRAYSHYNMEKRVYRDKVATFEEALALEKERTEEDTRKLLDDPDHYSYAHQTYTYLARGRYYNQLVNWFEYFDKEQFLFIKSEDFFSNPKKELERAYAFLGISKIFPKNMSARNVGGDYSEMSLERRKHLANYFKEDGKKLVELLGKQFSWEQHGQ